MTFRFLHISDIHFGQEREGRVVYHDDIRDMLAQDAGAIANNRGQADLILVTGDVAFSGKAEEFRRAGSWLDNLAKAVNCKETDVRMVPGNHDCDRQLVGRVCRTVHQDIRGGTTKSANGFLEDLANSSAGANPLLPKLAAYSDFAAGYSSDFDSVLKPIWTKDFTFPAGITLRLVGLNSVQVSDVDDNVGKMILGNTQYILPVKSDVIYVVLIHHPLNWLKDKDEAKQYLHNRARVIMVGHEHIPQISKTTDLENERLDISSGATNLPDNEAQCRHTYNWIELSLREVQNSFVLDVHVFPRLWVPEQTQFAPDMVRLSGKESRKFEIICRGVRPATKVVADDVSTSQPIPTPGANGSKMEYGEEGIDSLTDGANMGAADELALATLKFHFWRLEWRDRVAVLVQANVLPKSAVRPIPQTFERLAIETARQQGKLADVWDAMNPYLPFEKRQNNPFTPQEIQE